MAEAARKKKRTVWNFVDNLEGDKVVWMIALMLILFSIVCIFSSSSKLLSEGQTRLDIVRSQLLVVALGLSVIIICYNIKNIKFFRWCSKWGFLFSLTLLVLLDTHIKLPFLKAICINDAYRILEIKGLQIHVFEVVKVAMVMYISWAIERLEKGGFPFLESFKENPNLKFLSTKKARKWIYLYIPFLTVFVLTILGSNSSAILIAGIMALTIMIGGGQVKDLLMLAAAGLLMLLLCFGVYRISGGKVFERIGTGIGRISKKPDYEKIINENPSNSIEYQRALDKIRQPYSAKIAIKTGGLFGKGAGQSRQRYIVPDFSEDYMYSFILEEYGLLGGILVLFLYVSLLARGSIIVRNCGKDIFAKSAVAGLCLLITGQAFLHIFVNVDIGPMTGQTLPLISHGNSAFLCFSLAFGIILAISRIASRRIEKEQRAAAPLVELHETVSGLDDLEAFESAEDNVNELYKEEYDL